MMNLTIQEPLTTRTHKVAITFFFDTITRSNDDEA